MNAARSGKEARRAARRRHDSVLEIMGDAPGAPAEVARLVDASSGGASFTTTRVFVKGSRLRVRMRSLDQGIREFVGTIVRVERRTNVLFYAVEFDAAAERRP